MEKWKLITISCILLLTLVAILMPGERYGLPFPTFLLLPLALLEWILIYFLGFLYRLKTDFLTWLLYSSLLACISTFLSLVILHLTSPYYLESIRILSFSIGKFLMFLVVSFIVAKSIEIRIESLRRFLIVIAITLTFLETIFISFFG